jgi:hypothetical protein
MAHLRDISFGLRRLTGRRLAGLIALPLLIVTLPANSGATIDQVPDGTPTTVAATAAPAVNPAAGPVVTPAAAIVTPTARPESDDRQRRVLMLLLMNSAGPVRPYGNLGR